MTYNIELETNINISVKELYESAVDAVLENEKCPYEVEVSLVITDDQSIKEVNNEFRHIDKPTDVLSFPNVDFENPSDFNDFEELHDDCFNPDTGELILGDIMVSSEHVDLQAKEYGHSKEREFSFLIVHSVLHLLGYDHIEENDRLIMEDKQAVIMKKIGIER